MREDLSPTKLAGDDIAENELLSDAVDHQNKQGRHYSTLSCRAKKLTHWFSKEGDATDHHGPGNEDAGKYGTDENTAEKLRYNAGARQHGTGPEHPPGREIDQRRNCRGGVEPRGAISAATREEEPYRPEQTGKEKGEPGYDHLRKYKLKT